MLLLRDIANVETRKGQIEVGHVSSACSLIALLLSRVTDSPHFLSCAVMRKTIILSSILRTRLCNGHKLLMEFHVASFQLLSSGGLDCVTEYFIYYNNNNNSLIILLLLNHLIVVGSACLTVKSRVRFSALPQF